MSDFGIGRGNPSLVVSWVFVDGLFDGLSGFNGEDLFILLDMYWYLTIT